MRALKGEGEVPEGEGDNTGRRGRRYWKEGEGNGQTHEIVVNVTLKVGRVPPHQI